MVLCAVVELDNSTICTFKQIFPYVASAQSASELAGSGQSECCLSYPAAEGGLLPLRGSRETHENSPLIQRYIKNSLLIERYIKNSPLIVGNIKNTRLIEGIIKKLPLFERKYETLSLIEGEKSPFD